MKRTVIYAFLALLLSLAVAGGIGLTWLLQSPDGVRWLFAAVSRHTPVAISSQSINGALGTPLQVRKLSVLWPTGSLNVEDLRLRCQPLLFLFGRIDIDELVLDGVRLTDSSPADPAGPGFVWPRVHGIPALLHGRIERVRITDFSYLTPTQPLFRVANLTAAASWQDSRLTLSSVAFSSDDLRLFGTLSAGFGTPSLVAALQIETEAPLADCSRFTINSRLKPGKTPEQLAGSLTVTGLSGNRKRYILDGTIGIARTRLNLSDLVLRETGRRGTLTVSGSVPFTGDASLRLVADRIDLSRELGEAISLSGKIDLSGTADQYAGKADLTTAGDRWRQSTMNGTFAGTGSGISVTVNHAALIGGTASGSFTIDWQDTLAIAGKLRGSGLDPSRFDPQWRGNVNFDADGRAEWAGGTLKSMRLQGRLNNSVLREKTLAGEVDLTGNGTDLNLHRMHLTGDGFNIRASGLLSKELSVSAQISDLSGLVPGTTGSLEVIGRGRYVGGNVSGTFSGRGSKLSSDGMRLESVALTASLADTPAHTLSGSATVTGITLNGLNADTMTLRADGTLANHLLELSVTTPDAGIKGTLDGSFAERSWQGTVRTLSGFDRVGPWQLSSPAAVSVSGQEVSVSRLLLNGAPGERLDLTGRFALNPLNGAADVSWDSLNPARLDQWLTDTRLTGTCSGNVHLALSLGNSLSISGMTSASGTLTSGATRITLQQADLTLNGNTEGGSAEMNVKTGEGIAIHARFSTREPLTVAIPSSGSLAASWDGVDATLARQWLPAGFDLQGRLSGSVNGRLLPDERFALDGIVSLENGGGKWRDEDLEISAKVRTSSMTWYWSGETLHADIAIAMARLGKARGAISLPLPARFDTMPVLNGPIRGELRGTINENGMLSALFPGMLQETGGTLDVNLRVAGTWQSPDLSGTVSLSRAGAYLPAAGIRLEDIRLAASISGSEVTVSSYSMHSGSGSVNGTARILLDGWLLNDYSGTLHGTNFTAVHLPELQLNLSPEITFSGTPGEVSIRGAVTIPEMQVSRLESSSVVKPSRDVVIVAEETPRQDADLPQLDLQLKLNLGDAVKVKTNELDALLAGALDLRHSGTGTTTASGEIKVASGVCRVYGTTLEIRRGKAMFAGGPVDRPALDILALRQIKDVKAGVTVTGTPEVPLIRLYSEPALPDTDILSYLILGRKMGDDGAQGAALMQIAAALVDTGNSTNYQEKIKELAGLDTLAYSPDTDSGTGYRKIEPSLMNTSQSKTGDSNESQSILQIGKYLTPDLYVSYGRSLFEQTQQLRARYTLNKRWEIESRTSSEATGGDIFYKIEFD